MFSPKGIFAGDIQAGQQVDGLFLVKNVTRAETRNGKPFLTLTLGDRTGEVTGRVWDDADALLPRCPAGGYVRVTALAETFRDQLQLRVTSLEPVAGEAVDPADFMATTSQDVEAMWRELQDHIAGITDPHYRALLQALFRDPETAARFRRAPAAKRMHHAYLGGLLEHTLAIVRLALAVSELYPEVDRDLLVAGAVVHDLGKTAEFAYDTPAFDYTDEGRLTGHLLIGSEMVSRAAAEADTDIPSSKLTLVKHLILSHHGRYEFGAPALPMTLEALILHLLDDLDAKANYLHRLAGETAGDDDDYQWTAFQRPLERFLLVRPPSSELYTVAAGTDVPRRPRRPGRPRKPRQEPAADGRQPGLFD